MKSTAACRVTIAVCLLLCADTGAVAQTAFPAADWQVAKPETQSGVKRGTFCFFKKSRMSPFLNPAFSALGVRRIMKTAEEALTWLVETIGHIYDRPQMYAWTLNELDGVLYTHHFLWGFIAERGDWIAAHAHLCKGKYNKLLQSNVERSRVIENPGPADFKLVVDHWQKVDTRIGLVPPRETISN